MDCWILRNGQQQARHYQSGEAGFEKPDPSLLDRKAKAWADKQVPLTPPVTAEEAEKWDRAYLAARSEQLSGQCYDDDKVEGVIKTCPSSKIANLAMHNERKPCNVDYWKELIEKISGRKVAQSRSKFQFYYIRDGMNGMDTPFLANNGIKGSRNQNNVTWDDKGLQFHSDVNDALVIFDGDGNLIDVYRLSVPIVADVGNETSPCRIVASTLTPAVVNSWDGTVVYAYTNRNFGYTGIYPLDEYKTREKHRYWVDIHGSAYTYGCIEVVENLNKDAAGNCLGMKDTTARSASEVEELPDRNWLPPIPADGSPVKLGTMHVVPPKN